MAYKQTVVVLLLLLQVGISQCLDKDTVKFNIKKILDLVPVAMVQRQGPKLSNLIDHSFSFTEDVIEKQFGVESPGSLVVFLVMVIFASYIPMMIMSEVLRVLSFRKKTLYGTPQEMERFGFNDADSSSSLKLEQALSQLAKDASLISQNQVKIAQNGGGQGSNNSNVLDELAKIEQVLIQVTENTNTLKSQLGNELMKVTSTLKTLNDKIEYVNEMTKDQVPKSQEIVALIQNLTLTTVQTPGQNKDETVTEALKEVYSNQKVAASSLPASSNTRAMQPQSEPLPPQEILETVPSTAQQNVNLDSMKRGEDMRVQDDDEYYDEEEDENKI